MGNKDFIEEIKHSSNGYIAGVGYMIKKSNLIVDVCEYDGGVEFILYVGGTGYKNQRLAHRAMNWIILLADKHQVKISTTIKAENRFLNASAEAHMKWYERFGFVFTDDLKGVRDPELPR